MQYKLIGLASFLAVMASTAGADEAFQKPRLDTVLARCAASDVQDLAFQAACSKAQKPLRVSAETGQPKRQIRPANAKRITRMPWQTGIFQ